MDADVDAFLRVLDQANSSVGGGTASAVAGAMAAALVGMVARISPGKAAVQEGEEFYRELAAEAEALSAELMRGGSQDALGFDAVQAAYRLPRQDDAQKAGRQQAIRQAWLDATRVPVANAGRCARVLDLCTQLKTYANPKAVSDLECAGHLACAGLQGCVATAEINLPHIHDEEEAARLRARIDGLRGSVRERAAQA
jgi:formiminotetrahydrofolate cyclodeaminase